MQLIVSTSAGERSDHARPRRVRKLFAVGALRRERDALENARDELVGLDAKAQKAERRKIEIKAS